MLNMQKYIIHKFKWKYLIILDACRYDYFKKYWKEYKVNKVNSPASSTLAWLRSVFPYYYDYTVYSCNPFIGEKRSTIWNYHAHEHFKKVISLWEHKWDEIYSTVLPESVYEYCVEHAVPKSIIWFLQPHSPYIDLDVGKTPDDFRNWTNEFNPVDWSKDKENDKYTIEEIRLLYTNNLKSVIPYVKKLTEVLEKPIIITSDHGELLGEYGLVGHPNIKKKELREVPLVIIG